MDIASIVVSVSELYQRVKDMLNCGMDFVGVSIIDDPADQPATMSFYAGKVSAPNVIYRFKGIDEAEFIEEGE